MAYFEIDVEYTARGTAYVNAPTQAEAEAMIQNAPADLVYKTQLFNNLVKERINTTILAVREQIKGVDYIE